MSFSFQVKSKKTPFQVGACSALLHLPHLPLRLAAFYKRRFLTSLPESSYRNKSSSRRNGKRCVT